MKTRVKTGIIIGLIFLAVVIFGKLYPNVLIFDIVFTALCGVAVYEMLHNCNLVKSKMITYISMAFSMYSVLCMGLLGSYISFYKEFITVLFAVFLYVYSMFDRKNSSAVEPILAFGTSVMLGYAFGSVLNLVSSKGESGIFYLLICLGFAWITDMGAYFTGYLFGKHKLCPELSPKKTVEGAIGGALSCLLIVAIYCIVFNMISVEYDANLLTILLITVPMSVVGMIGDLIFSYIKRHCGIKDYGNILPGHGGILDRFDSILVIAPIFYILSKALPLMNIN